MPIVTLPGQVPVSLNVKTKSEQEVKDALANHLTRFVARRSQLANNGISFASSSLTVERIKCKLHVDSKDQYAEEKREQLRIALMSATTAGFSWPSDQVEVFVYQGAAFSVGWLLRQAHVEKAVVLLGDSAVSTSTKLVADVVKERESSRGERFAQQARIRTATFHELGHVQHQKLSPSHYFALSQIPMIVENVLGPGREESVRQSNREKAQQLFENTSAETLKAFMTRLKELSSTVSTYAGSNPCEFVAEVYSGLMMSVPFSDDVRAAYDALGGPPVDAETMLRLKGRSRSNAIWSRPSFLPKPEAPSPVFDIGEGLS